MKNEMKKIVIYTSNGNVVIETEHGVELYKCDNYAEWGIDLGLLISDEGELCAVGIENA